MVATQPSWPAGRGTNTSVVNCKFVATFSVVPDAPATRA